MRDDPPFFRIRFSCAYLSIKYFNLLMRLISIPFSIHQAMEQAYDNDALDHFDISDVRAI